MNFCQEFSQSLKEQNVLILDNSAVKKNEQESGPQIEAFKLNKGQQIIQKNLFPGEKRFRLNSPYFEFCLKANDSSNDYLESAGNSENYYKYSSCKGKEKRQLTPLRKIKSPSEVLEENLKNGVENKATCESEDLVQNGLQETVQLMKSKKRRHENGEDVSFPPEESVATKMSLLKTENEICMKNPYQEFILKSEVLNSRFCVTGNSEKFPANSLTSEGEIKMNEELSKNRVDIFGNQLTSRDKNKMKVNCPHCTKKVPAPGFVRHLSYCMGAGIRKSKRRL